ncbi:MAG: hypothetical protein P8Y60_13880 [Calditrichota bacterium]
MKQNLFHKAVRTNGWMLFYLLVVCYAIYQFGLNNMVFTKSLIFRTYQDLLPENTIMSLLQFREQFEWTGYLLLLLFIPLKAGYAAVCVNTGTLLAGYDVGYKQVFKTVLIGEFIFLLAAGIHIIWLTEIIRPKTLQEAQGFYPLSLLTLFPVDNIPEWLYSPLTKINLFELGYVSVITLALQEYLRKRFMQVFPVVILSYGMGALLIIILFMFLSLQVG